MKRIFLMFALLTMGLGATAQEQTPAQKKTLVTYFSASGITRNAAKQLAEIIGADLYEITPEVAYTNADLDWRDKESRSYVEMHDKSSRPAIKGNVENMDTYDTVYIGFPIWWNVAPTIINTFIEANDFTGKTVVPFATSGSSTIENSCKELKATYPDLKWKEGLLLNSIDKAVIEQWVK